MAAAFIIWLHLPQNSCNLHYLAASLGNLETSDPGGTSPFGPPQQIGDRKRWVAAKDHAVLEQRLREAGQQVEQVQREMQEKQAREESQPAAQGTGSGVGQPAIR